MSQLDWTAAIEQLAGHLTTDSNRWPDPKTGEFHADCPFCKKEAKRGQRHFAIEKDGKFICSVCHKAGGMKKLADQLGTEVDVTKLPGFVAKPRTYYDYTDESGALLYQVVRYYDKYDEKQIRPRRLATDADRIAGAKIDRDGFVWSITGLRRVLYQLPALIESVAAGHTVYLTEGEKDADSLLKLGWIATTNSFGALTWSNEFSSFFAGADVVLLRDNDLAGARRALLVATALRDVANSIKCVLLPDLPAKGDVTDWLEAGRTAEDLLTAIDQSDDEYPTLPATIERASKSEEQQNAASVVVEEPLLPVLLKWDQLGQLPRADWIVDGIIPARQIVTIFGASGTGKTYLTTDIACSIASSGMNVVYVAAEDAEQFEERVGGWMAYRRNRVPDGLHFWIQPVNICDRASVMAFVESVRHLAPSMVVLDPLANCMVGYDDSSTRDMNIACDGLHYIRKELQATVIVVHHTGWSENRERGSVVLRGNSRVVAGWQRRDEHLLLTCEKINGAKQFDPRSFELKECPGHGVVLMPAGRQEPQEGAKPSPQQFEILDLLSIKIYREEGLPRPEIHRELEGKIARTSLSRALSRLCQTGHIEQEDTRFVITEMGLDALDERGAMLGADDGDEIAPLAWDVTYIPRHVRPAGASFQSRMESVEIEDMDELLEVI